MKSYQNPLRLHYRNHDCYLSRLPLVKSSSSSSSSSLPDQESAQPKSEKERQEHEQIDQDKVPLQSTLQQPNSTTHSFTTLLQHDNTQLLRNSPLATLLGSSSSSSSSLRGCGKCCVGDNLVEVNDRMLWMFGLGMMIRSLLCKGSIFLCPYNRTCS